MATPTLRVNEPSANEAVTTGLPRGAWLALAAALLGWMFDGAEMAVFSMVGRPALMDLLGTTDDQVIGRWFGLSGVPRCQFLNLKVSEEHESTWQLFLAQLYYHWAENGVSVGPRHDEEVLELTARSIQHVPVNDKPYMLLKRLAGKPGPVGQRARQMLFEGLACDNAPALIHGLLAELERDNQHSRAAIMHWQVVLAMVPASTPAMNNIAWELAWLDPPDLEGALATINRALEVAPGINIYLETRGQIFARMGRTEEALSDLQAALPSMQWSARLHATLAEIYNDLQIKELAARHAREAAKLAPGVQFRPARVAPKSPIENL